MTIKSKQFIRILPNILKLILYIDISKKQCKFQSLEIILPEVMYQKLLFVLLCDRKVTLFLLDMESICLVLNSLCAFFDFAISILLLPINTLILLFRLNTVIGWQVNTFLEIHLLTRTPMFSNHSVLIYFTHYFEVITRCSWITFLLHSISI